MKLIVKMKFPINIKLPTLQVMIIFLISQFRKIVRNYATSVSIFDSANAVFSEKFDVANNLFQLFFQSIFLYLGNETFRNSKKLKVLLSIKDEPL